MGLPHSLINAAKQGGVPVDQVELDKQGQTGNLVTKGTSVQENKDTSTSPWPYPHGMVCNKSTQIGTKRWLVNLGSLCEFLPSYFSTEAGLSASQVLLLSWSGAHLRGLADFKLISLRSLDNIPSGCYWNETPGLVTNMRTHWKDEYLYTPVLCHPPSPSRMTVSHSVN